MTAFLQRMYNVHIDRFRMVLGIDLIIHVQISIYAALHADGQDVHTMDPADEKSRLLLRSRDGQSRNCQGWLASLFRMNACRQICFTYTKSVPTLNQFSLDLNQAVNQALSQVATGMGVLQPRGTGTLGHALM